MLNRVAAFAMRRCVMIVEARKTIEATDARDLEANFSRPQLGRNASTTSPTTQHQHACFFWREECRCWTPHTPVDSMASPDDRHDARRNKQSGLYEAAVRFWQKSYAGDYLGLTILVAAYLLISLFGEPFHQMFRLNDYRLQHPHAEVERVPVCEYIPQTQ